VQRAADATIYKSLLPSGEKLRTIILMYFLPPCTMMTTFEDKMYFCFFFRKIYKIQSVYVKPQTRSPASYCTNDETRGVSLCLSWRCRGSCLSVC